MSIVQERKLKITELCTRMIKHLGFEDLAEVEKVIRRCEPEGKAAFKQWLELRKKIRTETDEVKKEKLITEALELGREYDF